MTARVPLRLPQKRDHGSANTNIKLHGIANGRVRVPLTCGLSNVTSGDPLRS